MTTDLTMLAWVAAATLLMWLPYILKLASSTTLARIISYEADNDTLPAWAARAKKAHYNAVENLAPFAALVLVAHVSGAANNATAISAIVYFWARIAHYFCYMFAIPAMRTITFTIGWLACVCIFWNIVT